MLPNHQKEEILSPLPWQEGLPLIRGRYLFECPMASHTWFKVGGPASVIFKPADLQDLQYFLRNLPTSVPVVPLGVGSNVLIRDGGIKGVVIRLGRGFSAVTVLENHQVLAGAGALDKTVAQVACQAGVAGLSFLSGIPGTVGGAVRMNAGAYGVETKDVLVWAEAVDRSGALHRLHPHELGHSYRHCLLPDDWIFVRALWQGKPGRPDDIAQDMTAIQHQRQKTQPVRGRTGGSTFANPANAKAWALIDAVGLRGARIGDAEFSTLHCNFMINHGQATAQDLESLGELARQKVKAAHSVDLKWEIKILGEP